MPDELPELLERLTKLEAKATLNPDIEEIILSLQRDIASAEDEAVFVLRDDLRTLIVALEAKERELAEALKVIAAPPTTAGDSRKRTVFVARCRKCGGVIAGYLCREGAGLAAAIGEAVVIASECGWIISLEADPVALTGCACDKAASASPAPGDGQGAGAGEG